MIASIQWDWKHKLRAGMREEVLIWVDVPGVALKDEPPPRVSLRIDAGDDGARALGEASKLEWTADRRLPNPCALRTAAEKLVRDAEAELRKANPSQAAPAQRVRDPWERHREAVSASALRHAMGVPAPNDGGKRSPVRTVRIGLDKR